MVLLLTCSVYALCSFHSEPPSGAQTCSSGPFSNDPVRSRTTISSCGTFLRTGNECMVQDGVSRQMMNWRTPPKRHWSKQKKKLLILPRCKVQMDCVLYEVRIQSWLMQDEGTNGWGSVFFPTTCPCLCDAVIHNKNNAVLIQHSESTLGPNALSTCWVNTTNVAFFYCVVVWDVGCTHSWVCPGFFLLLWTWMMRGNVCIAVYSTYS